MLTTYYNMLKDYNKNIMLQLRTKNMNDEQLYELEDIITKISAYVDILNDYCSSKTDNAELINVGLLLREMKTNIDRAGALF